MIVHSTEDGEDVTIVVEFHRRKIIMEATIPRVALPQEVDAFVDAVRATFRRKIANGRTRDGG